MGKADGILSDCQLTRRRARMRANRRRMTSLLGAGGARNWRGLRETGAWEDGSGRAWLGGKENRGKPQEAARWFPGHGGPVSHVPGFPSQRALAARPDSMVPVSWRPRRPGKFVQAQPGCQGPCERRATSDEQRACSVLPRALLCSLLTPLVWTVG